MFMSCSSAAAGVELAMPAVIIAKVSKAIGVSSYGEIIECVELEIGDRYRLTYHLICNSVA